MYVISKFYFFMFVVGVYVFIHDICRSAKSFISSDDLSVYSLGFAMQTRMSSVNN